MGILAAVICLAGGLLAASGFIASKKPNAKEALDKLLPYQTGIGIAMVAWGLYWTIFGTILNLSIVKAYFSMGVMPMIYGLTIALSGPVLILTGFLLAYGLIAKKTAEKKPELAEKMENTRKKLAGYVTPLGILCIVFGVIYLLAIISPGLFMPSMSSLLKDALKGIK